MTDLTWWLLATASLVAVADWFAVATRARRLEYAAKPGTMVVLIAIALLVTPRHEAQRWAFVAALVLSLAGDVLLMLDDFIAGLIAFFAAHIAYIAGLRMGRSDIGPLLFWAVIVVIAVAVIGNVVIRSVREKQEELVAPVSAYIAVIAVMGAAALASGNPYAAVGAVLFMASDSLIAWNRFVRPLSWAPVTIMVTYHAAQVGLTMSLTL